MGKKQHHLANDGVSSCVLNRKANMTWQSFLFFVSPIGKLKETSVKQGKLSTDMTSFVAVSGWHGWLSGESAGDSPLWPGFDSSSGHM